MLFSSLIGGGRCGGHVLGGQHLGGTVGLADFHLLAGQQLAVAFEHGDAVGLHQGGDAAGEVAVS